MLTYFALLGLPEWTALSRVQRRFVWQQCAYPLLDRWQMKLAKLSMALLAIFVAFQLGGFDHMGTTMVVLFIVVILLPDSFDTVLIARHRRQVSSFIQSHGTEIQSAS